MSLSSYPAFTSTPVKGRKSTTTGTAVALFMIATVVGLAVLLYLVLRSPQVSPQQVEAALEPLPPLFDATAYQELLNPLREIGVRPAAEASSRANPFQ